MTRSENGTAYTVSGQVDGPPVVLIHGLGLCRALWRAHLPAFEACFRVINYDLWGHGGSEPAPNSATLAVFSQQVLDLLDELAIDRAALVGFSIGGMINRRFALDHSERLSALAILNSPHNRGPEAQAMVEERAAQVATEGAMATMDAALLRWFTPAFRDRCPEAMQLVRDWRDTADKTTYPDACMALARGVVELIDPAQPITAATLVMTCENDSGSTPKMSRDIAAEIPNAQTIVLPELQHLGLMEQPAAFTDPICAFLNNTLAAGA